MTDTVGGFSFPFRIDSSGRVALSRDAEKLRENVKQLLLTGVGERVMQRGYGGNLSQLLHDPNNDALRTIVQHQIGKALGVWEPRVQIQGVTVIQQEGTLSIRIDYLVKQTQQPESVSVPIGLGGI